MNFDYTDDQRHLRDEARRFLTARCPLSVARSVLDDKTVTHDAVLWGQMAEQGWLGMSIPESFGGLGLGAVELGAIAEAIGAALAPVPFGSTLYLLAEAIKLAGSESQKQTILPGIAQGRTIGCAALFEGAGDLDYARIGTRVTAGRLTGSKCPVVDGGIADMALVVAREDERIGLYLAQLSENSVTRTTLEAIDGSMNVARLDFADTPVALLTADLRQIEALLARAAVLYGFEQIGAADRCLRLTVDYVSERQAFGGPVGRFQAVKHKLADLYVANELARSHVFHGSWAMQDAPDRLMQAAAAARLAACDAGWLTSKEAIHLHGAIGYTWDHDAHLFYRRAHHWSLNLGSPQSWKDRLFEALAAAA